MDIVIPKADQTDGTDTTRTSERQSFQSEDLTYRSTRLAAEEARDRFLAEPLSSSSQDRDSDATASLNTDRTPRQRADDVNSRNEDGPTPRQNQDSDETTKENADEITSADGTAQQVTDFANGGEETENCMTSKPETQNIEDDGDDYQEILPEEMDIAEEDEENNSTKGDEDSGVENNDTSFEAEHGDSGEAEHENAHKNRKETGGDRGEETKASALGNANGDTDDTQEKVFITETSGAEADGSDIDDVRAETPNWEEEGEDGNEAGSVSDVNEATNLKRHQRLSASSRARPLTRSTMRDEVAPGQRAVVNTPVSYLTTADYNAEIARNLESRNTSHGGIEAAREAAYQRAMTLMTTRCESSKEGEGDGDLDSTYGPKYPQMFYVQQSKPSPMPPLKAWKGYHGNVYFQPLQIQHLGSSKEGFVGVEVGHKPPPSVMSSKSATSRRRNTSAVGSRALVPVEAREDGDPQPPQTRSTTHMTQQRRGHPGAMSAKSGASSSVRSIAEMSQHHVLYLDRQMITNPENSAMNEELQVLEKQQATGSLNVHHRTHFLQPDFHPKKVVHGRSAGGAVGRKDDGARRTGSASGKFDRICRGSVANKLRRAKSSVMLGTGSNGVNKEQENSRQVRESPRHARDSARQMRESAPANSNSVARYRGGGGGQSEQGQQKVGLVVVGDKFAPSTSMSPLLRMQTQFTLSQRMGMNSPDMYGPFERFPPLEQVRFSLRHMDAHSTSEGSFASRVNTPYSTTTNRFNTPYSRASNRVNTPFSSSGARPGIIEELKPFIKYSPDVKAQYNKQINLY